MATKLSNGENGTADAAMANEKVILTPVAKGEDWTILQLDRKRTEPETLEGAFVAGGSHKGLVVNRQLSNAADYGDHMPAQVQLDFNVFLVDQKSGKHSMENRLLRFWFKPEVDPERQMWLGAEYFKELVNPETFPRDYVGFITRLMKLMQKSYTTISTLKIHLKQLPPPSIPPKPPSWRAETDSNKIEVLTEESLLEMIERAFPNGLAFKDIAKCTLSTESEIHELLLILAQKGLIKQLENGTWIRWSREEESNLKPEAQTTFVIGKHMPTLQPWEQPTIAVITALFCEKLAVDAMMDNKETFVRYQTQGEGTVYTLGNIGPHRIVCTKLPAVGHDRAAMIAAGNTTTRLLGIFQRVEYVFVVGCGGAVPHYTSYQRHVRLGDIVASAPSHADTKHPYIYVFCDEAKKDAKAGTVTYATKSWRPPQQDLQMLAQQLKHIHETDVAFHPWKEFMDEGMERLANQEMNFERPPQETDKLYMAIGETDVIQVSHPQPVRATSVDDGEQEVDDEGGNVDQKIPLPRIHLGPIGGGRAAVKDQTLRQDFATHYGCLAFDYEFDPVLESIFGNRKDHYMCIRGMSDYRDGMRNKEWQPYASLAAAAFMKSIIMTMQVQEPEIQTPPPAYSYSPQTTTQRHHHHHNNNHHYNHNNGNGSNNIYASIPPPVQVLPTSASPIQMQRGYGGVAPHLNPDYSRTYVHDAGVNGNGKSSRGAVVTPPQQARQSFV